MSRIHNIFTLHENFVGIHDVDVARSPGSALRVFTSRERLANQLKINEIGEVGKLVTQVEMDAPKIGKLVKKNEMGNPNVGKIAAVRKSARKIEMSGPLAGKMMKKVETGGVEVGELVKKIQMNEPKVGKVGRSVGVGQEERLKLT